MENEEEYTQEFSFDYDKREYRSLPEPFWRLTYTYLYDYKEDSTFLIFHPDAFGFGGRLVHTRPKEQQDTMIEKIVNKGYYVPCFQYWNKLCPFTSLEEAPIEELKRRWKENYFKYVPFKVDEYGTIISEPLFDTEWLTTVDEYRVKHVDIYAYEPKYQETFEQNKAKLLEAKEFIRQAADNIFDNL